MLGKKTNILSTIETILMICAAITIFYNPTNWINVLIVLLAFSVFSRLLIPYATENFDSIEAWIGNFILTICFCTLLLPIYYKNRDIETILILGFISILLGRLLKLGIDYWSTKNGVKLMNIYNAIAFISIFLGGFYNLLLTNKVFGSLLKESSLLSSVFKYFKIVPTEVRVLMCGLIGFFWILYKMILDKIEEKANQNKINS